MRCRYLRGCAPPSVSLPSRLRRCHRVPGSEQMLAGRRQGPWPVPSGPATSHLASGRCWPSASAHRYEDGSRHLPSLTPGTWPPPSPAGVHALGSVVSWSSPLRSAVPWHAAASPARCRREASSRATSATPPLAARDNDACGRRCRSFGLHGRVHLAVPDDTGLDRLPDVLDAVLTCGGAVAASLRLDPSDSLAVAR
jgi:hypothetical protein